MIASHSIRHDTFWAAVGAVAQAANQALMLVLLSRCASEQVVGQYALGLAIATPLNVFADRATRMLQATATDRDFALHDYLGFRCAAGWLALAFTVLILVVWDAGESTAQVVLLVALVRLAEGVAQTLYGRMHRYQQMRLIGRSQLMRACLGGVVFGVVLITLRRLELALLGSLIANLLVIGLSDRSQTLALIQARRSADQPCVANLNVPLQTVPWSSMLKLAVPLGLATFLVAVTISLPRLVLVRSAGEATLGRFAVLCYCCFPATIVVSSMMQSATPRLALLYRQSSGGARLLRRLVYAASGLALSNMVFMGLFGLAIVGLVFGPEYARDGTELTWIAIATGVGFVSTVPATALIAQRRLRASLAVCCGSTLVCLLACVGFIPAFGIRGAAWSMLLSGGTHLVASTMALLLARDDASSVPARSPAQVLGMTGPALSVGGGPRAGARVNCAK